MYIENMSYRVSHYIVRLRLVSPFLLRQSETIVENVERVIMPGRN